MNGNEKNLVCHHCRKNVVDENFNYDGTINKCRQWLNDCSLSESSSVYEESLSSDSIAASTADGLHVDNALVLKDDGVRVAEIIDKNNDIANLTEIINKESNHFENIRVYKSKNVHIGDITHINGPVYINQFSHQINQQTVFNQSNTRTTFSLVPRRTWLAQPPLYADDVKILKKPVKFVIISHSATEEAYTQTENNLIVRLIQQFHVESLKWNDIGYNFLFGAEGSVYEGRGWEFVGAHAFSYNRFSIGICFIGCYIHKLPPAAALTKAKDLIKYGVETGAIAEDYKLLGHCQCSSTESPGKKLFEEIKTWEHWDGSVSVDNPSPLIQQ